MTKGREGILGEEGRSLRSDPVSVLLTSHFKDASCQAYSLYPSSLPAPSVCGVVKPKIKRTARREGQPSDHFRETPPSSGYPDHTYLDDDLGRVQGRDSRGTQGSRRQRRARHDCGEGRRRGRGPGCGRAGLGFLSTTSSGTINHAAPGALLWLGVRREKVRDKKCIKNKHKVTVYESQDVDVKERGLSESKDQRRAIFICLRQLPDDLP